MNLTVNIESDDQLRKAVKDMIKGQVMSFVREDFHEMVKEELERKLKTTGENMWKNMMKEAMEKSMRNILYKEFDIGRWSRDWVQPIVERIVNESVSKVDWEFKVDKMADEKIRKMLSDGK